MVEVPPDIATRTSRFTTRDGLSLFERSWIPSSPPRATLILVHGYAEHSGRYDELASFFCSMGVAVHAFDQRGAGQSDGRPGRIHRFARLVEDVAQFTERHADGSVPCFIFGQSLGGDVVLDYLLTRKTPGIAGAIVTSPAIRIATPFPDPIVSVLQKIAPVLPVLPTVPLDRSGLSRDADVVAEALADPSNYTGPVSLGTAVQMIKAGSRILDRAHALTTPILIIVGTGDTIVQPEGSFQLYAAVGSNDKTLAIYEGLYHETFREPEKRFVMDGIRLWLEEHLPTVS